MNAKGANRVEWAHQGNMIYYLPNPKPPYQAKVEPLRNIRKDPKDAWF